MSSTATTSTGLVTSPMPGRVVRLMAEPGQQVEEVRTNMVKNPFGTAPVYGDKPLGNSACSFFIRKRVGIT